MFKRIITTIFVVALVLVSTSVIASEVPAKFQNPEQFKEGLITGELGAEISKEANTPEESLDECVETFWHMIDNCQNPKLDYIAANYLPLIKGLDTSFTTGARYSAMYLVVVKSIDDNLRHNGSSMGQTEKEGKQAAKESIKMEGHRILNALANHYSDMENMPDKQTILDALERDASRIKREVVKSERYNDFVM
ncbi:MAG: hypothetical protein ACOC22_04710 [bacterium]